MAAVDVAAHTSPRSPEVCLPADPPPATPTGLTVGIGGGSGEIIAEWDRNTEPDLDHYELWYSDDPSATKTLLTTLAAGTSYWVDGRLGYVDFPRTQTPGKHCYQVAAVDVAAHTSPRSPEVCYQG